MANLEQFIITEKQNVDSRDEAANTPLHYAAGAGHVDAVNWLLDHGADINALNLLKDTPLHRVRLSLHIYTCFAANMILPGRLNTNISNLIFSLSNQGCLATSFGSCSCTLC